MKGRGKRVILFVGDDAPMMSAKIPDDSLLVGYTRRPLERTPEFVLGPEGDVLLPILEPGEVNGYTCERCQSKATHPGYVIEPLNYDDRTQPGWKPEWQNCIMMVAQCQNCGMIFFPESKECVDAAGVQ